MGRGQTAAPELVSNRWEEGKVQISNGSYHKQYWGIKSFLQKGLVDLFPLQQNPNKGNSRKDALLEHPGLPLKVYIPPDHSWITLADQFPVTWKIHYSFHIHWKISFSLLVLTADIGTGKWCRMSQWTQDGTHSSCLLEFTAHCLIQITEIRSEKLKFGLVGPTLSNIPKTAFYWLALSQPLLNVPGAGAYTTNNYFLWQILFTQESNSVYKCTSLLWRLLQCYELVTSYSLDVHAMYCVQLIQAITSSCDLFTCILVKGFQHVQLASHCNYMSLWNKRHLTQVGIGCTAFLAMTECFYSAV